MKPYPIFGLLASGLFALTLVNSTQAQDLSSNNRLLLTENSSDAIACFAQVRKRVLTHNARLKSQSATLRSLRAQTQQAALLPNPVITFEAENFGGGRTENDLEYTGGVSQRIETGGKRQARTSFAEANADAFELQRGIATAELLANARVAYAEVVAAKSRVNLSKKEVAIRREARQLIERKSSHGGALRLEVEKAEVSLQTAVVVRDQRLQEFQVAKRVLASLWGSNRPHLEIAAQELRLDDPEAELLRTDAREIPQIAFAKANRYAAEQFADMQRALAVPDVTVSARYRRFDATDDHAFVSEVSVPLPLFDRNQFASVGAEEQLKASEFDVANTQSTVNAELESRRDRLRFFLRERNVLQKNVLPQTERVLKSATEAYQLGRISYLDYIDAQTTYLGRRERLIAVTLSAIRNQVDIQRLNGTLMERITQLDQGKCNAQ